MKQLPISENPIPALTPSQPSEDTVDLRSLLDLLRRRRKVFLQTFVLVLAVGIVGTILSKTVYETEAKLLVPQVSTSVNLVDASNPIAAMLSATQPDSVTAQAQVLQSPGFLKEAEEAARVRQDSRGVVRPSVKVQVLREGNVISNVIGITVKGGDPNEIARLANTVVDLHLQRTDQLQTAGLKKTIQDIRRERDKAAATLKTATTDLLAFRRGHNTERLTAEQKARGERLVQLQAAADEAAGSIRSIEGQIANLRGQLQREPLDIAQSRETDNPLRSQIEEKIRQLEVQRTSLLETFQPDSEDVRVVDAEIASFKQKLAATPAAQQKKTYLPNPRHEMLTKQLAELEGGLLKSRQDYAQASAALREQQKHSGASEPWEVRLAMLTEARDHARSRFATLSDRLQDLEIRLNSNVQMMRAIERAEVPSSPIQPNRPVLLVLSGLFAFALALGMAFLVEFLDDRVGDPAEVQRVFGLPTVGHVPLMEAGQASVISALPTTSGVSEAYRSLRSSIEFAGIDVPIRVLQLTSATKGEGKSTTAVNLAMAMALGGKRVILVDADLRRPSLHRVLEVPSQPGLTEVLVGATPLERALQETGVDGLRVLSAGPIPPNPAELLASSAFDRLLSELSEMADLVIVDTPPCLPVSDPVVVAARVDAVVLVVNAGQTRKPAITHVLEMLSRARARVVGVVLNRIQRGGDGYYYHYYGDGYYADAAAQGQRHRERNGRRSSNARLPEGPVAGRNGDSDH